jgi:hypothetical protein
VLSPRGGEAQAAGELAGSSVAAAPASLLMRLRPAQREQLQLQPAAAAAAAVAAVKATVAAAAPRRWLAALTRRLARCPCALLAARRTA